MFTFIASAADTNSTAPAAIEAQPQVSTTFWALTAIVGFFGAFGGILAAVSEWTLREIREQGCKAFGDACSFWSCITISGLQGVGGALAFAGIAALDGHLTINRFSEQERVIFAFLSVATGFAGHKFLLLVSRRLTKDIEDTIAKQGDRVAKQLDDKVAKQDTLAQSIITLRSALLEESALFESTARRALKTAALARQDFPTDRRLAILWGRILVRLEGYDSAIALLGGFMADYKRLSDSTKRKVDYAALLFNRACYRNKRAEELTADSAAAENLREEAWKDLEESCRLDPENRGEAHTDTDLGTLFNEAERSWSTLAS